MGAPRGRREAVAARQNALAQDTLVVRDVHVRVFGRHVCGVLGLVDARAAALARSVFVVGVAVGVSLVVSRCLIHATYVGFPGNASPRSRAAARSSPSRHAL